MSTEKEQLENLMAMAEQSRLSQKSYFKSRNSNDLRDAKIKEDALDNLLKHLRSLGFEPRKIISKEPEQNRLF